MNAKNMNSIFQIVSKSCQLVEEKFNKRNKYDNCTITINSKGTFNFIYVVDNNFAASGL